MGYSYGSALNMPIYERRLYLDYFQKELEEQKRQNDKAVKGRR